MTRIQRHQRSLGKIEERRGVKASPLPVSPFQPGFKIKGNTTKEIVALLLAEQKKTYGETILESIPYQALLRHAKLLQKTYNTDDIKRAIIIATYVSRYAFSFKLVEESIHTYILWGTYG